ncbi:MAG: hypothetical protein H6722_35535 [Sandaracinus sp.]|nr:hypothetical protein [Sandaracinus sp.]
MLGGPEPELLGNTPHRTSPLILTNRKGEERAAGRAERAATLTVAPAWAIIEQFADDPAFLDALEEVFAGKKAPAAIAARYQRTGSYGWRVVRHLVEEASAYATREKRSIRKARALRLRRKSPDRFRPPTHRVAPLSQRRALLRQSRILHRKERRSSRTTLRSGLVLCAPAIAFFVDGAPSARHRQRWRASARSRAMGALLARGAGVCLAEGCDRSAPKRYCSAHLEMERSPAGVPQANPKLAKASHDQLLKSASELLKELGEQIGVE